MNHPAKGDPLAGSVWAGERVRHLSRCDAAVSLLLLPPLMADAKVAAFRSPEIYRDEQSEQVTKRLCVC